MKSPSNRLKKNYTFQLTKQDFENLRRLAERDTEGNISFYVRKIIKQDLAKNAAYLDSLRGTK